jgi:hypothetical protein
MNGILECDRGDAWRERARIGPGLTIVAAALSVQSLQWMHFAITG